MIKKIVGLTLAFVIILSLTAGGIWAYLQDSERSADNLVTAGRMDLKTVINPGSGYVQYDGFSSWFTDANFKAGYASPIAQMWVRDEGTVAATKIDFAFSISGTGNTGTNGSLDDTLKLFKLVQLNYGRNVNLLNTTTDGNLDPTIYLTDHGSKGYYDLYDLTHDTNTTGIAGNGEWEATKIGPLTATDSTNPATGIIKMTMQLSLIDPVPASLAGTFMGNGLSIDLYYTIHQQ